MSTESIASVTSADPRFAERYRAMSSRDSRFDGQFITGVHSTGIYCRPSCPAMTPKPSNVTFYRTAAAAHQAGLRACKRCLPDAVPGSPAFSIHRPTSSTVTISPLKFISLRNKSVTITREQVAGKPFVLYFSLFFMAMCPTIILSVKFSIKCL